jgi:hypothetical protein
LRAKALDGPAGGRQGIVAQAIAGRAFGVVVPGIAVGFDAY